MGSSPRTSPFWIIYALVWFPYAASYVVVFNTTGVEHGFPAIRDAVANTAPAAALGIAVVALCERIAWRRAWFFAIHLGLAALYATLMPLSVSTLFTIMTSIERGRFTPSYLHFWGMQWALFSGFMIYATLASVCYARQIANQLRAQEARAERLATLRTQAELEALRARLNPHFLFNTLHSLMALVRRDPGAAETAIEQLATLLRYVLDAGAALGDVRLEDELAFIDSYLELERLRLGERLRVERQIDPDALECRIPALTVQPLVENAIKHAIAPRAIGGTLTIVARLAADDGLHIEVRDDGPGADLGAVGEARGLGLRLVRQRLETRYPRAAALTLHTAPGAGFAAHVVRAAALDEVRA